jgi:hypothetical protein
VAEAKAKAGQEARAKAEREARERAEAKAKAGQEAREKAEREARERAEAEAKAKAEQEARQRAEQEARAKAEAEAQARAEQEAREQAERDARLQAEVLEEDGISAEEFARERAAWQALKQAAREERERERREHEELWAEELAAQEARVSRDHEARTRTIATDEPTAMSSPMSSPMTSPMTSTVTATPAVVDETPAPTRRRSLPSKALLQVALAAALVAAVIVVAPRVSGVAGWAQGVFAKDAPTTVGTAMTVKATSFHPDVEVLAGAPVDVKAAGGAKVAKGQHLVAVPLRLTNQGLVRWDVAPTAKTSVVDGLGVAQHALKGVSVKGMTMLTGAQKIAPGKVVTGYVVFAVPEGRAIRSVTLALGEAGDEATWRVAP